MGGSKGKGEERRGRGGWKGEGKWWPDEDKGGRKGKDGKEWKSDWKSEGREGKEGKEGKRKGAEWRGRRDEWVPKEREGKGREDGRDGGKEGKEGKEGKGKGGENRSQLSSKAPDFTPGLYDYSLAHHLWVEMPPLWQEFADSDGSKYYYNAKTGLTQWEKPAELEQGVKSQRNDEKRDRRNERNEGREKLEKFEDWSNYWPREGKGDKGDSKGDKGEGKGEKGEGKGTDKGKKRRKEVKEKEPSFGPAGCNLFVFHLPDDWTDDDLMEYFAPHGNVVSAKVMKELGTGRSRGFGFVSYEDRVSAATAIKKMQGYKILGKRLKVEFKKGEGEGKGDDKEEEKASGDDERLIGYLRAISAKSVVQSLKESEQEEKEHLESQIDRLENHEIEWDDGIPPS